MVDRNQVVATSPSVVCLELAGLCKSAVQARGTSRPTIAQLIVQKEPQHVGVWFAISRRASRCVRAGEVAILISLMAPGAACRTPRVSLALAALPPKSERRGGSPMTGHLVDQRVRGG